MTFSLRMTVFLIGALLSQGLSACTPQTSMPEPQGLTLSRVSMPDTEVRQLKSSVTNRDYDIYIRLPDQYVRDQGKKYPVLYVLDGQWDFKLLDSIEGGLL